MNFLKRWLAFLKPGKQPTFIPQSETSRKSIPAFNPDELSETEMQACRTSNTDHADALWLKKFTRRPIELFEFENCEADKTSPLPAAICSLTTEEKARQLVTEHAEAFIQKGKYIFINEIAHNGYKVAIVSSTNDPYEIMRYAGTNGYNHNISTEDIITRYKKWDNQFGIRVITIGFDLCECTLINPPQNFKALADEVYEFCPDVVDQGTETVENLAAEMQNSGSIYLWWD